MPCPSLFQPFPSAHACLLDSTFATLHPKGGIPTAPASLGIPSTHLNMYHNVWRENPWQTTNRAPARTPAGTSASSATPVSPPSAHRAESGNSSEGRDARHNVNNEAEHRSGAHSSVPKADAWREKNRLAQKAFRQRQKVCGHPRPSFPWHGHHPEAPSMCHSQAGLPYFDY
jgi:hypothetical protein